MQIRLNEKQGYVTAITDRKNPLYRRIVEHLAAGSGPEDYITSQEVSAGKPVTSVKQDNNRAAREQAMRADNWELT